MKKFALTALAAAMATLALTSAASADSRYGDDDEWRRHGHNDRGEWDGRRDNDRHGWRDNDRRGDDEWRWRDRPDHWRRHHHDRRHAWRPHFRDDFCFVKKVRRYDEWGNLYIKRVRVCR
jgi:hypothetical protein